MKTIGTQQRLLDAAEAELIATDGHLEMEAAARRADARIGLAYAQFGSKSGLMAAVIDRYYEPIREIVIGEAIPLKIDWRLREKTRLAAIVLSNSSLPLAPYSPAPPRSPPPPPHHPVSG